MLPRLGDGGLTVHFNIHMDPSKFEATPADVADVLTAEVAAGNATDAASASNSILGDIVIDTQSIDIQGKASAKVVKLLDLILFVRFY
jgi:hypothetical protein